MTSEVRYIFFSEAEVASALVLFEERRDIVVLHDVRSIQYETEPEVLARVAGPDGNIRVYPGPALAAALLFFCGANGVMIPRRASKSLQVKQRELVLCLSLGRDPKSSLQIKPFEF